MLLVLTLGCNIIPPLQCEAMFVQSAATVEFDGELPDGEYVFEAIEGGETVSECIVELSPESDGAICDGSRVGFDIDSEMLFVITPDLPDDLEVVIWQDDVEVASHDGPDRGRAVGRRGLPDPGARRRG
ncbi:MAG: hypothetical protein GY913_30615 [Proteobacteria bacterium]|nr:hypothetical protein [Pseudomonadota bacterium]MCP4921271.1 hypothetical protein [Pseudomonadota bacterium]